MPVEPDIRPGRRPIAEMQNGGIFRTAVFAEGTVLSRRQT